MNYSEAIIKHIHRRKVNNFIVLSSSTELQIFGSSSTKTNGDSIGGNYVVTTQQKQVETIL